METNSRVDRPGCFRAGSVVYLRALSRDDIPGWAEWFNDARVTKDLNKGFYPNSHEAQAEVLDRLTHSRTDVQLGIVLRSSDTLVGVIGLHHIDWVHRRGDISVVIGEPAAWGQGAATEAVGLMVAHAFQKLNLHKVNAGMWATNLGSRRSFEKNGFRLEGTIRDSFWCSDRWVDEIRLGLLRDEWEAQRRGAGA